MREELQYQSGCLIYFHYKVYKRVQKRKKEEAAKKKKKNAKKGKGKKGAAKAAPLASRPSVATPAKTTTLTKTTSKVSDTKTSEKKPVLDANLSQTMALPQTDKLGESGVGAPTEQGEDDGQQSAGEFDRANSMADSALNNDDPININTPKNPELDEIREQNEESKENTSVMDVEARDDVATRGEKGEEAERAQPFITILDSTGKESLMGMEQ